MTVRLKQRTYVDKAGKVSGTPPSSGSLIGPEGARISDETAVHYGLLDGYLPDSQEGKALRKQQDKERKGPKADKTGRRKAGKGQPLAEPKPPPEQEPAAAESTPNPEPGPEPTPEQPDKAAKLGKAIESMVAEAEAGGDPAYERLFTNDGKPDSRVLAARIEDSVTADERDAAWETCEAALAPDEPTEGDESEETTTE